MLINSCKAKDCQSGITAYNATGIGGCRLSMQILYYQLESNPLRLRDPYALICMCIVYSIIFCHQKQNCAIHLYSSTAVPLQFPGLYKCFYDYSIQSSNE